METRKLELKDIVGYLPYGLNYMNERKQNTFGVFDYLSNLTRNNEYIKPILLPLSDLYKIITHNGKEIIPIVELAKISFGNDFDFRLFDKNAQFKGNGDNIHFWYSEKFNAFGAFRTKEGIHLPIQNQYELFDYLHELKIDYRGLIDAGLAIDVNTLENNPYV